MANPQFPDVPKTAGVPPVRRDGAAPVGEKAINPNKTSAVDATKKDKAAWGIYSSAGSLVLEPDSIQGFEYSADYRIADYPLAPGAFESYDKVSTPFNTRLTMAKGGTLADRTEFLKTLDRIKGTLALYNVVTPEKTYLNVNIDRVTMQRTAERGATLLTVEVELREIRQTATQAFSASPPPAPPSPTPQQDTRPPSTAPGTTRRPASTRRVSRGSTQRRPSSTSETTRLTRAFRANGDTVNELPNGDLEVIFGGSGPDRGNRRL